MDAQTKSQVTQKQVTQGHVTPLTSKLLGTPCPLRSLAPPLPSFPALGWLLFFFLVGFFFTLLRSLFRKNDEESFIEPSHFSLPEVFLCSFMDEGTRVLTTWMVAKVRPRGSFSGGRCARETLSIWHCINYIFCIPGLLAFRAH